MGISRDSTRKRSTAARSHRKRRDPFGIKAPTVRLSGPRLRRLGYSVGQHGFKKKEQARLSTAYPIKVTGNTHESEHAFGYETLSRGIGAKRGKSSEARSLENRAPAYQEVKAFHRAHIGTGTHGKRDASGFNSQEYRDTQNSLLASGDASSALQINQLAYAFLPAKAFHPAFQQAKGFDIAAADDSYTSMVGKLDAVPFTDAYGEHAVVLDATGKAEAHLARHAARSGDWPSKEQIAQVKKLYGL
jgi:hypothetical protein